ncbi:hypothetical protein CFC21_043301 [Triticum aestivum]|uniref:DUF4220 domain-containing protein n=2 Tax=Triticum aestivum TaxID=4565 RepID=A0A3B6FU79_WHEAT|nr:uncharacterized protein LOC123066088 [Triticum aestivum]KAF7032079.1 hypothetical protein CFC21_043301 [Triticum aestivum]
MPGMEDLVKLFNVWEIQLFVLLSFTLQIFLFFTGSLRRHSCSMLLRLSIWAAYLGADFVAVYTLGLISRLGDITTEMHTPGEISPLAFFWAPFLLIHIGGQDTITAFAMEDNNLWLRHLLNLVVQSVLAIYVFWKSIGRHSPVLIVSGVFVFVVGIIKYAERTWSLKSGCYKIFESSSGHHYKKLPHHDSAEKMDKDGYDSIVYITLCSMPRAHNIICGHDILSSEEDIDLVSSWWSIGDDSKKVIKIVGIILSVMYADLYTKALVVRTRSAIILRCISQMSAVVAFAMFFASDKQRYSKTDIAITYSLFWGGFFLELCAMFIFMMSPWTWAWLKVRKWDKLAMLSWLIFSSDLGWSEKKQCFVRSMGQYNYSSWMTGNTRARTFSQGVMAMVKWFAGLVHVEKKKIFWMSKLLDTECVDVDEFTMECIAGQIRLFRDVNSLVGYIRLSMLWNNLLASIPDFGIGIVALHVLTEKHLSEVHEANTAGVGMNMMEVCRKLSRYMMYLLATHPSMLPLSASPEAIFLKDPIELEFIVHGVLGLVLPSNRKKLLEELASVWARLLIYAAGKSRPERHMEQLSTGGEFITFVWLLMSSHGLGDSQLKRIGLTNTNPQERSLQQVYAFPDHEADSLEDAANSSEEPSSSEGEIGRVRERGEING